jgi:hypothetical protein
MTASVIVTWRFCASSERVRARGHRESIRHDDVVMATMPLKRSRREIGISYGRFGGVTLRSSISDLHRPRPGTGRAGGTQPGAAHGGGQPVSPKLFNVVDPTVKHVIAIAGTCRKGEEIRSQRPKTLPVPRCKSCHGNR